MTKSERIHFSKKMGRGREEGRKEDLSLFLPAPRFPLASAVMLLLFLPRLRLMGRKYSDVSRRRREGGESRIPHPHGALGTYLPR